MLKRWEAERCIPRNAKITALVMMVGVGGGSMIFAVESTAMRAVGGCLLLVGALVVLRLPTCPPTHVAATTPELEVGH